jgi:hypothetical protein
MDFGKFDPPISPELALVDPELASYARSLLPPIDLDALSPDVQQVGEGAAVAVPALPAGRRRRTTRRRAGLLLVAAIAVGGSAALAVIKSGGGGDGSSGSQTAQRAAGGPKRTSTTHTAPRGAVTARVDGARKTVVSPATKTTGTRAPSTTSQPAKPATRQSHAPVSKARKAPAKRRQAPAVQQTPVLRWPSSPSASFFDVVLWRGGKRLLDSWPSTPRLQVPSSWTYGGARYRLSPGTYLWFVYPGLGSRLHPRYGPLLKSGQFTIASPPAN